jgi:GMP synthase-like glutamine amidotransferase
MKQLKIHCFQHVEFEDLGCIKDWISKNDHQLSYTRFYRGDIIPVSTDYDWLIIMGGPMSVHDEDEYPWLAEEKKAIRQAIEHDKTVIGICLGSQLLANALRAKVFKNPEKEIGWFDIKLTGTNNVLSFDELESVCKVFHWHGDTFDIPSNAKHLAYSEGCKNQAFLYKENVLGLQFHLEVTEQNLKEMLEHERSDLTAGKYIQSEQEILNQKDYINSNKMRLFHILESLNK